MKKRIKRIFSEDISPTLKDITSYKYHKHVVEIKGNLYERIGKDMLYCIETSRIFRADKIYQD